MPLIIPSNSISAGGYVVDNSCRFNSGSSDYLTRTPSGTGNRRTWTFSAWVKRTNPGAGNQIFQQSQDGSNYMKLYFSSDKIFWRGITGGSNSAYIATNRLFRDVSAWYHIVARFDSTNGTAGDRMRLYVNGVEETSFSTDINPSSNYDSFANTTNPIDIGRDNVNNASYFNGYMAEVCMVDGQSLAPDQFGEFDEDSGIWKPIDVSGLTFGTNGFYLDFENSGSLGADVSGNGNNFTVNNLTAIDQTTDTPTNNFATLNPLDQTIVGGSSATMTDGNITWQSSGNNTSQNAMRGTFGLTQGKWYWEVKYTAASSGDDFSVGICGSEANLNVGASGDILEGANPNVMWLNRASNSSVRKNSSDVTTGLTDANIGDIIMLAVDMDNLKFFVGINGTWLNSANPVTGDNEPSTIDANTYLPAVSDFGYGNQQTLSFNFGNPPFTGTDQSDGNSRGSFEYAPPSGFLSLCSANLSEVLG